MSSERQHAHNLLDRLTIGQLSAVVRLLESIIPPEEDDDLSGAERSAIADAEEWLERNAPIPHEEVLAEFGLTATEWEKMAQEPERHS